MAGGLYGIFSEKTYASKLVRGNNAVPYIRVKDVEEELARVRALPARMIDTKIVEEGPMRLFKFADPDGNVIEFFSFAAAPAG